MRQLGPSISVARTMPRRAVRLPTTGPWNSPGHSISIFMTGSKSTGRVLPKFSRMHVRAHVWNAMSELSTS